MKSENSKLLKTMLVVTDYQRGFVDLGNAAAGKPAMDIEDYIYEKAKSAIENGRLVIFTGDKHVKIYETEEESKMWPPHCIEGTEEVELYGKVKDLYEINKDRSNVKLIYKRKYSAFSNPEFELSIKEFEINNNVKIEEIEDMGVSTNICCAAIIIDAYNKGYSTSIHRFGTVAFSTKDYEYMVGRFEENTEVEKGYLSMVYGTKIIY